MSHDIETGEIYEYNTNPMMDYKNVPLGNQIEQSQELEQEQEDADAELFQKYPTTRIEKVIYIVKSIYQYILQKYNSLFYSRNKKV